MPKISILGKEYLFQLKEIPITDIRFDEWNPRLSFHRDESLVGGIRYDQKQIEYGLKLSPGFEALKTSIENNRGAINPIWIKHSEESNKYTVVEGNTRLAVYQTLADNKENGNPERFKKINCFILPNETVAEDIDQLRLSAHLHGQTPWDAYEKAKYLYKLSTGDYWSDDKLVKTTKLSKKEIRDSIDAYRLMEEKYFSNYGKDDTYYVQKFSYFVEFLKNTRLKKIMAELDLKEEDFCEWVGQNKLEKAVDVRKLHEILKSDKSRQKFLIRNIEIAREELSTIKPELSSSFFSAIAELECRIEKMTLDEANDLRSNKNKKDRIAKIIGKLSGLIKHK